MEIDLLKISSQGINYSSTLNTGESIALKTAVFDQKDSIANSQEKDVGKLNTEKLDKTMDEMNKAMDVLETDLHFKLHEKTGELMVQVVDVKKDQVIKEFPPHEFLDTKAKIRDYIGMLLDKKV